VFSIELFFHFPSETRFDTEVTVGCVDCMCGAERKMHDPEEIVRPEDDIHPD
jgi:hypothetical protein